jgi:HPt (histidine-containing phosphotransfer) domain-containing protein
MAVAHRLNFETVNSSIDCVSLDVDFLNRNTFGDSALRSEILGLFLAQLDGVQRTLSTPVNDTSWQFVMHTLKGAAAAVGASSISTAADLWGKSSAPASAEQRRDVQQELTKLIAAFKLATQQL